LKEKPFNIMVTGEKGFEYRKPGKWIESRLMFKSGEPKPYDFIVFTNGYGHDKPRFKAKYLGFIKQEYINQRLNYSNGLEVLVNIGDYVIGVGEVVQRFNLKGLKKIKRNSNEVQNKVYI